MIAIHYFQALYNILSAIRNVIVNPLLPSWRSSLCGQKFDFEIRVNHGKISYERCRVYESVDDRSLYYVISRKSNKKIILEVKSYIRAAI